MAAILNSTYKTFCGVEDTEMRKTQSYLGYYKSLELGKEVEATKNNRSSSRESTDVDELFKENKQNEKKLAEDRTCNIQSSQGQAGKMTEFTRKVRVEVGRWYNRTQEKKVINNSQCCKGQEKD